MILTILLGYDLIARDISGGNELLFSSIIDKYPTPFPY